MNYKKKGLKRLLKLILNKEIERLVLTHKDRLLRFGSELIFTLCEMHYYFPNNTQHHRHSLLNCQKDFLLHHIMHLLAWGNNKWWRLL